MTEYDMSWVESGYISHHTTVNQFPTDDDTTMVNSSTVYENEDIIRDEPTSLDGVSVSIQDQSFSVTSSTSTIAALLGGMVECMQPVRSVVSSVKGYFNPYKLDSGCIKVDVERDYYDRGMEGDVLTTNLNGQQVAVKRLLHRRSFNPGLIERMCRQRPANIVHFIGYTVDPPQYVMEFLPHGTIETFIREGGEIPPRLLVLWSRNIVNGLEYLHNLNVIHCDLKTANLMFDTKGEEVKIIDFESSITIPEGMEQVPISRVRGTTPYMSPEMIKQVPCTSMVDIWGFGIVLWEMTTLKPPYKGKEDPYVFYGIGMNKISLPIPDDIPDGIRLLLQMCWKQAPEARPAAFYIKKHLVELEKELEATSSETYRQSQMSWRQDCSYVEFDMEEIRQWRQDLESYHLLQTRYAALMTSYNSIYQELKLLRKGQEPRGPVRSRKRSSRNKKKAPSKASLLFSNNNVSLTRTVSAPAISNKNSLDRLVERVCEPPRASTLGAEHRTGVHALQPSLNPRLVASPEYASGGESESSASSRGSTAAHADVESGADTPGSDQDHIVLPLRQRFAKIGLLDEEGEDSALDLSLSSQLGISSALDPPLAASSFIGDTDDEFGEVNLDTFGIRC